MKLMNLQLVGGLKPSITTCSFLIREVVQNALIPVLVVAKVAVPHALAPALVVVLAAAPHVLVAVWAVPAQVVV